jgi:hypothetical protein
MSSPPALPPRIARRADRQALAAGVFLRDEVLGAGDEIVKRVALVQQLAVLVPRTAHLPAAAHVGDGDDEAAVEQAQLPRIEGRIGAGAVGAVAVEHHGVGTVALHALAVDHGDRHAGPVGGGGEEALLAVAGGVVSPQHLLLFDQLAAPRESGVTIDW